MKYQALALLAASAAADHGEFLKFNVIYNDRDKAVYFHDKEWAEAEVDGKKVCIEGNNSLFMRKEADPELKDESMWKPAMRGGNFRYIVDLSQQGSGCVAGGYLVDTNDEHCREVD